MIANTEPHRIGEMSIETRGGSGPAGKLDPEPHTTHSPELEIQVVC